MARYKAILEENPDSQYLLHIPPSLENKVTYSLLTADQSKDEWAKIKNNSYLFESELNSITMN